MSKTHKITPQNIENAIMAKVKSNEIAMRPRWYFVLGSLLTIAGVAGFSVVAVFLTNVTLFLVRRHGPMGELRLQLILDSFPWWVPLLAIVGVTLGVWMLRRYDFSYKKNFGLIIAGFIASIIFAAFILDYVGLNDTWSRQGPMRRFYQQLEGQNSSFPRGQGQGRFRN